jgi:hypothetical protein
MKLLYCLALFFISGYSYSQNLKCGDFKTGKFKIEITNYDLPSVTVIRTEKIQKEIADGSKDLEGSIVWKSECNYDLTYLNGPAEMNGKIVSVEIIKIEGEKAICKSTFEDMPGIVLEFIMQKIN